MIGAAMFRLAATRAVMMQMRPFTSVMPQGITRSCDRQPCPRGARQLDLPRVKCRPYLQTGVTTQPASMVPMDSVVSLPVARPVPTTSSGQGTILSRIGRSVSTPRQFQAARVLESGVQSAARDQGCIVPTRSPLLAAMVHSTCTSVVRTGSLPVPGGRCRVSEPEPASGAGRFVSARWGIRDAGSALQPRHRRDDDLVAAHCSFAFFFPRASSSPFRKGTRCCTCRYTRSGTQFGGLTVDMSPRSLFLPPSLSLSLLFSFLVFKLPKCRCVIAENRREDAICRVQMR